MATEMYDPDKAFEDLARAPAPLSWRDVYKAVYDSEQRLTKQIDRWGEEVQRVLNDHEKRLSVEEDFTVGVKASGSTAERFFSFGKWIAATVISVCALIITAIAVILRVHT